MNAFDPFGWLARRIPERTLHVLLRAGAVTLFLALLVRRVSEYETFRLKVLWVVETALYAALTAAYAVRRPPVERSVGVREIVVPLVAAALPFALLATSPHPAVAAWPGALLAVFWWMTAATSLTVWGLWSLRRAFSITVEARGVVTAGPYRWVRHPVYLGEVLATGAVAAWRFSPLNLAIFGVFVVLQILRARWEEAKLRRCFAEYDGYARRAWWIG